jgi:hypothetical protein
MSTIITAVVDAILTFSIYPFVPFHHIQRVRKDTWHFPHRTYMCCSSIITSTKGGASSNSYLCLRLPNESGLEKSLAEKQNPSFG